MKKLLLMLLIGAFSVAKTHAADLSSYVINDQQIEQVISNSEDVSVAAVSASTVTQFAMSVPNANKANFRGGDKNFVAALLLNLFLGGLGIHRLYLGTKTITWVGYILTCGGIFGVVPLVDLIVLIIHNDDISEYVDNPSFFMWG